MAFLFFLRRIFSVGYLMSHPAVPMRLKSLPAIAFVYLIFPRDLIIDFRPFGVGGIDDLVVVTVLLTIFINKGLANVARYDKRKSDSIDADFRVLERKKGRDAADGRPSPYPDSGPSTEDDCVSNGPNDNPRSQP
jgi:uncharacterized membrane protein YkvA (DUF1232 family)